MLKFAKLQPLKNVGKKQHFRIEKMQRCRRMDGNECPGLSFLTDVV